MKTLFIPLFILSNLATHAQLNTDSLIHELLYSGKFKHIGPVDYLMKPFQQFKTADGLERYDVCINPGNKLKEYIGLSIVYRQYDAAGRKTKIIGYNKKGEYDYWDFSPITTYTYVKDTTITEEYNHNYILTGRKSEVKDKQERIIETLYYDKDLHLYSRVVKKYNDQLHELLIKYYDGHGNNSPDDFGAAFIIQKFDPTDKESTVEEYFLNEGMKPVDADHRRLVTNGFMFLNYSHIKKQIENGEPHEYYYNSKEELVCEVAFGSVIVTHIVPVEKEPCEDEIKFEQP
ncbi:MAG: hypothetical protein QM737_21085 [Ferruginibacter sp.]